ncbi:MAG: Fe(3+) ABC transporter substrate-binding protein [Alphaproteobacteria bacterium]
MRRTRINRSSLLSPSALAVTVAAILVGVAELAAADQLNIYSARHYQTDEALYARFTEITGISVNRIEDNEDPLLERIVNEGVNSPADVLITVDAGRLWRADQAGIFAAIDSPVLTARIPVHLRHPDGHWFGFATRARVIVYAKDRVDPATLATYQDLADPRWHGKVCMRSGSNIYNLSLLGSIIAHDGAAAAEAWAAGVVANMARPPEGGDTDQIKAVAAGECDIAVANTYYYVRLVTSDDPDDNAIAAKVGVIFPNQATTGTHVNVSGAGVLAHAPHPEAALKFLEYLASDEAQRHFADGNNEYPVVPGLPNNRALQALGNFRADTLPVAEIGANQPLAQQIFDRVGWQ